jgi:hypothetical protein
LGPATKSGTFGQALARAIVGDDQNGDPSRDDRQLRPAFAKGLPVLPPTLILLGALRPGGRSLLP